MKQKMILLFIGMVLMAQGTSYANSCASVKREMTYGRVALQDAKNKQDYLDSAKQFEAAIDQAPSCAAAHFNLGVVYEKAGEYQKALKALKKYLSLAPGASDADKVQEKIYELEFRAKKAKELRPPRPEDLAGYWRTEENPSPVLVTAEGDYYIAFDSFDIKVDWAGAGRQIGKKLRFRLNGYQLEGVGHSLDLRSEGNDDQNQSLRINCLLKLARQGYKGEDWRRPLIYGKISKDFKRIVFRYTDIALFLNECRIGSKEFTVIFQR